MIDIGVNEGVYLSKAHLNDKDTLELTFEEVGGVEKKAISPFARLNSEDVVDVEIGKVIRIFKPLAPDPKNDRTEEKNVEIAGEDVNAIKAILTHIAKRYLTSDDVRGKFKPFEMLPIDENNYNTQILKQEILNGIMRNLSKQFIQLISPFLNKPELSSRLLLVRQSIDKAFPTFRKKYLDENPFYEDSAIVRSDDPTTNQSKVKFTQWELDNKFNSAAPIEKDSKKGGGTGGSTGGTAANSVPLNVTNVFGPK